MLSEKGKDCLKLNIGGTVFHTTKSTLTKFDGFFKTKYGDSLENNTELYIDRDPKYFGLILNFMRDGRIGYLYSEKNRKEIEREARFYLNIPIIMPPTNVKLNVGGRVFQTTRRTLTKFDGFFKTMMMKTPLETDEDGAIFVDRSPKHFEIILNYMRDGFVNVPDSTADAQEIQMEAQYYLLDGLVKLCDPKITILKQHKSFLKRLSDEILGVFDNSSKKGVLIVPYIPDPHVEIETKVSPIVENYGAEFVICSFNPLQIHRNLFSSVAPEPNLCALYDNMTGKVDWFQEIEIENIMKKRYGIGY